MARSHQSRKRWESLAFTACMPWTAGASIQTMLADWSRLLRLCLVLTTVTAATTYKVIPAYADDDDDEDDADDSDEAVEQAG